MSWILKSDEKEIVAAPKNESEKERLLRDKRLREQQEKEKARIHEETIVEKLDKATRSEDPAALAKAIQEASYGRVADLDFDVLTTDDELKNKLSSDASLIDKYLQYDIDKLFTPEDRERILKLKSISDDDEEKVQKAKDIMADFIGHPSKYLYEAFLQQPQFYRDRVKSFYEEVKSSPKEKYGLLKQFLNAQALLGYDLHIKKDRYRRALESYVRSLLKGKARRELTTEEQLEQNVKKELSQDYGMKIEKVKPEQQEDVNIRTKTLEELAGLDEGYKLLYELNRMEENTANLATAVISKEKELDMYMRKLASGTPLFKELESYKKQLHSSFVKQYEFMKKLKEKKIDIKNDLEIIARNGDKVTFTGEEKSGLGMVNIGSTGAIGGLVMFVKPMADSLSYLAQNAGFSAGTPKFKTQREIPALTEQPKEKGKKKGGSLIEAADGMSLDLSYMPGLISQLNSANSQLSVFSDTLDTASENLDQAANVLSQDKPDANVLTKIFSNIASVAKSGWSRLKSLIGIKSSWIGESTWLK